MKNNIFEKYVVYSKKCLYNYVKVIMGSKFEQEIFDHLLKTYIDTRYYNRTQYKDDNSLYKIGAQMVTKYEEMEKSGFESLRLKESFNTFRTVIFFDSVAEVPSLIEKVNEIALFREEKLGFKKNDKFTQTLFENVKSDLMKKKNFIDAYETNDFEIQYFLLNDNDLYETILMHKLKFPRLYNKNSIDKVFSSKEISEESLYVEYKMVSLKVLKDVIVGNFRSKYLLRYSPNLNDKKTKQNRLFEIIDNDVLKEKAIIKIFFADFLADKDFFYSKIRHGFRFAICLDESFIVSDYNLELLTIFRYVMVDESSKIYNLLKNRTDLNVIRK